MDRQSTAAPTAGRKIPAYAWVVLFSIYMATLAAPLNQFKVPPLMPVLRDELQLSYGGASWLMSIFSIMGIVLAIPAGFILQRFGIKATGLIGIGATMVGAGLGALAQTSGLLFSGRFIEGAGMGLIMVVAPAAISLWFDAEKRALPMGIWASSVGIGYFSSLNLAPVLVESHGWHAVWWVGAAVAAVAFILFAVLFRLPKPEEMPEPPVRPGVATGKPVGLFRAMANRNLWLLSISFGCFNLVVLAINSFYTDFLNTVRQYPLAKASFISSLVMLMAIFFGPLSGHLSDRLGSRKAWIVAPFILLCGLYLVPFTATGWMIPAFTIALGILAGPIAPVTLATVPETMPSLQLAGIGMGVATMCQNLGMFAGPMLFGKLLELTGQNWAAAGYMMIPICAIGAITAWLAKIR
ncbi:MAG: transporter [Acidobacteria bacterium]|nr:transporter [Acidobacteriota bacterium]